jgi:hypothetical protein
MGILNIMVIRTLSIGSLVLALSACGSSADSVSANGSETPGATTPSGTGDISAAANPLPTIPGSTRYTFTLTSFQVAPSAEVYKCQDFPNPFGGSDVAILQSQSVMSKGSHHMFAYKLAPTDASPANLGADGAAGPLVDCPAGGLEFHPFFHTSQTPVQVNTYPAGVGRALNGTDNVRLQVHYINTTTETITAAMTVTIDTVAPSAVKFLAAELFVNAVGVNVPPGASTQTWSTTLPQDINLVGAGGHMHSRGTHFEAGAAPSLTATNWTHLYSTDTWDEPQAVGFDPPLQLAAGDVIKYSCSYSNSTANTLTFGESAAKNEMCIFSGTYYPAPGGVGIYANLLTPDP